MPTGASSNSKEIIEQLEKEYAQYKKGMELQIFRALSLLEAEIIKNLRGKSGLHVRTGALINSIGASKKIYNKGDSVVGEIGPEGIPYAAIHEFGGTIVPKNAQWLTIPSDANRRPDGLPRMTASELISSGKSFVAKNTIFMKDGSEVTPMFFLKKSVKIPARPYLATAFDAKKDEIFNEFGLMLEKTFGAKG